MKKPRLREISNLPKDTQLVNGKESMFLTMPPSLRWHVLRFCTVPGTLFINKYLASVCKILRLHQGSAGKDAVINWRGNKWGHGHGQVHWPSSTYDIGLTAWHSPLSIRCHWDATSGHHYLPLDSTPIPFFYKSTQVPNSQVPNTLLKGRFCHLLLSMNRPWIGHLV